MEAGLSNQRGEDMRADGLGKLSALLDPGVWDIPSTAAVSNDGIGMGMGE